jgi:hypothetical protein
MKSVDFRVCSATNGAFPGLVPTVRLREAEKPVNLRFEGLLGANLSAAGADGAR